ncbi:DNA polymerase [Pseudoxanthomonas kalamensis DSM 18571]|uniref:DNA polymerase Y family protein n=1 Tax=Pseudoxanthomonas kalamensis TaxID=289483 RepID=UPI0013918C3D|nr:DNA polymerase [Pseudoxanthomonas kalamensis]KAF1711991.1 DNA polymerase [Pseudoxanthomonas kalamensis DSM 18571]
MTLRCLFVDFNSYFASVEQEDRPALRGKPVGVVPVLAETTCCIAASIEAKEYGIGTGTLVSEARAKFPDIELVEARPARYVEVHHRLMDAIGDCIPHGKAESIDEVPCWLIGRERRRDNAVAIAEAIKRRIADEFEWLRCSIGIAPNKFLAKTASDMRKPDGLTVLEATDLPQSLLTLELNDFCGIGPSMLQRLHAAGIRTSAQLCAASRERLRLVWGSVEGERFWMQLHGHDLPERRIVRGSIGHSHVLGPELRNFDGARSVLFKLLAKAAMRMRKDGLLARGLSIRMRFVGLDKRFERDLPFAPIDDTPALLHLLGQQLASLRRAIDSGRWNPHRHPPLSVAVTLTGLEEAGCQSGELMPGRRRDRDVSRVIDAINRKYGNNSVYFGAMQQAVALDAAPMRIPFQHVPETEHEEDAVTRKRHAGPSAADAGSNELWLLRERQTRKMAENAHRQARQRPSPSAASVTRPPKAGVGGWTDRNRHPDPPTAGETGQLF